MTDQTQKSTPGVADRGHHEAITTTTSGSESTSMDTLWNLENMTVDGRLGSGRAFSRDELTDVDVARFKSKVDRSAGPDACHLWTAGVDGRGYGKVKVGGRTVQAHRVAYVLSHGFVPAGLVVRHRCDTPKCCRPDHLTIGTHRDNSRDAVERGRQAKGEGHGAAKLTVDAVNDMRRRARAGASYAELAREYRVNAAVVCDAVTGETWKSATEPPVVEVRCQKRPWTPAEDAVVLATLDDPVKVVAARLGRARGSVANRRAALRKRQAVAA